MGSLLTNARITPERQQKFHVGHATKGSGAGMKLLLAISELRSSVESAYGFHVAVKAKTSWHANMSS